MDPKNKIDQLTDLLHQLNHSYYMNNKSEVSDFEFDMKMKELELLEKEFPQYKRPDSPTSRVGGTITKEFQTVKHKYPMLSLGNTYNEQDLKDFDERVRKVLVSGSELRVESEEKMPQLSIFGQAEKTHNSQLTTHNYEYVCEQKFDGVAISLTYENGILTKAVTRGDGVQGDDVTNNIKTIKSIPLKINSLNLPDEFEVRGEVFLSRHNFEKINKEREDIGEALLANPRNAASGTLKMQDSSVVAKRQLNCFLYSLNGKKLPFNTHSDSLKALTSWGFQVSPTYRICKSIEEVMSYIHLWEKKRFELPLDTDGIVLKVNSFVHQDQLGFTAKTPRWAISFKYKSQSAVTKLNSITYQVGRTGAVTPVANLEPVLLAGTTVKRASLHNANEIERLDIRLGDFVHVEKGGEIIPKITCVELSKRHESLTKIVYLSHCPECGSELIRQEGEANHYCPNEEGCPPQIKGKFEHFIQRKAMNIDGMGSETIEALVTKGMIKDMADIYELNTEKLNQLERFGEKSISNLLKGIETSKEIPFRNVLFALGIRFVGLTTAEKLANHFENIENISKASLEQLLEAPEVGEKIAQSVIQYFSQEENLKIIERLKNAGLQFENEARPAAESNKLEGKSFVVSGVFQNFSREEITDKILANGGKILSGVSGKLDFLVAGENMGPSKLEKATKLGVKIVSEEEFLLML
ncbi:MAG: NAD-dependent DNA ligase LigA [Opitutaceae bacterium]|nr:NAD-dependent DNA ligase LigA [Cytophagales bacterium]